MAAPSTALIESIAAAERHIRYEYDGDWDKTLTTVHPDARYSVMASTGLTKVVSGRAAVAEMYYGAEGVVTPQSSRLVVQIATDWYVFFENYPTRIHSETGEWRTSHSALLLPIEAPLIKGEMLWEQALSETSLLGAAERESARSLLLHERLLDALVEGEVEALSELIDSNACWAERDMLSDVSPQPILDLKGRNSCIDYCHRWHDAFAPEHVSILNRVATAWYVFAEELWTVREEGKRRQYRKATIYPVTPAGLVQGSIGWGTDLIGAGPGANKAVGLGLWERAGSVPPDPTLRSRRA